MGVRSIFQDEINSKFSDYVHIFTDAALDRETSSAGFGIYCPQLDYSFSSRLPRFIRICTAETVAINQAVEL